MMISSPPATLRTIKPKVQYYCQSGNKAAKRAASPPIRISEKKFLLAVIYVYHPLAYRRTYLVSYGRVVHKITVFRCQGSWLWCFSHAARIAARSSAAQAQTLRQ